MRVEPNIYDEYDYKIVDDTETIIGKCNKEVIDAILNESKREESSLFKLYKDLNTLKWLGNDNGWDLAIEAVREKIGEILYEK